MVFESMVSLRGSVMRESDFRVTDPGGEEEPCVPNWSLLVGRQRLSCTLAEAVSVANRSAVCEKDRCRPGPRQFWRGRGKRRGPVPKNSLLIRDTIDAGDSRAISIIDIRFRAAFKVLVA